MTGKRCTAIGKPSDVMGDNGWRPAEDAVGEFGGRLPGIYPARDDGAVRRGEATLDWDARQLICPQGLRSVRWKPNRGRARRPESDGFFVPDRLGRGALPWGLVWLSPALVVRKRSASSATVRRRCHAVGHSPGEGPFSPPWAWTPILGRRGGLR
ncbi:hypothetical protein GCM10010121_018450 [Streptomyces brasiliensis]|uniref:Uncharacterized protein n=1 Tax=Streptomyces brasiliensis TaxID=1954 RepID=A0A917KC04_9ACTN|nr:hypothetical protein GCM10010121_018450 [Streptomyces brasiliensis]